jgi:hypothetical protein
VPVNVFFTFHQMTNFNSSFSDQSLGCVSQL